MEVLRIHSEKESCCLGLFEKRRNDSTWDLFQRKRTGMKMSGRMRSGAECSVFESF